MKTDEFKKILKPLIEKTVREVLLQEGVLSRVVSEVAKGLNHPMVESKRQNHKDDDGDRARYEQQKKEKIKRLNESVGLGVFDDVQAIPESDSKSPLANIRPGDSGVDISAIQKLSAGRWKALAGGEK